MTRRQILFFVKFPEPGKVKTRLARSLGDKTAARLYAAFVDDMINMLQKTRTPVAVHFAPPEMQQAMRRWMGPAMPLVSQGGADLGERMHTAFAHAFTLGVDQAVLLGSDLPDLPHQNIEAAFKALDSHDCALAPAGDGGYHLIGCNRDSYSPTVFQNITWSTPQVFAQTMQRMDEAGLSCARLREWPDIDTMDDLNHFRERLRQHLDHGRSIVPATFSILNEIF